MTRHFILMAGGALLLMSGTAAYADCAEELAALEATAAGGGEVAKDGSLAPMQEGDAAAAGAEAGSATGAESATATAPGGAGADPTESGETGEIAKDGSQAPLEEPGDTAPDVATSAQDAQAQQEGGEPAAAAADAAAADAGAGGSERDDALARARAALAEGDEAGCMAALEEARSL